MEKAIAKSKKRKFKNLPLFMIALPGIVYLLINNYIPMFGIFLHLRIIVLEKVYSEVTGAVFRISSFCSRPKMLGL